MPTFAFCAFRFLTQWEEREHDLYRAICNSPQPDAICRALAYFQVSRTFTGLCSKRPETAAPILKLLNEVRSMQELPTPEDRVEALAQGFQNENANWGFNLSAASKLLWLSYKSPYVIYDRRAFEALKGNFGQQIDPKNYRRYLIAWRQIYTDHEACISEAIKQLPDGVRFMRSCSYTENELASLADQSWFKERVFDVYLWELGG